MTMPMLLRAVAQNVGCADVGDCRGHVVDLTHGAENLAARLLGRDLDLSVLIGQAPVHRCPFGRLLRAVGKDAG